MAHALADAAALYVPVVQLAQADDMAAATAAEEVPAAHAVQLEADDKYWYLPDEQPVHVEAPVTAA